eukprot:TRINITY_DN125_c0_g1_i1.p1 TRINITY_DN125_c0_g1~~TRINITY_DN125_c0_g1_i1.p1  ORF type:complete len:255 (-),score=52.00 TRINITY_DN125_c0_g1_i1:104-868(-)
MREFESLSRGSCFLVRPQQKSLSVRFHVVAPGHVTHPFKFPTIYPDSAFPWLKFVTSTHVRNAMQIRKSSGETEEEFSLRGKVFLHPQLDLSVLHLTTNEEDRLLSILEHLPLVSLLEGTSPHKDTNLVGHIFQPHTNGDLLLPKTVRGQVVEFEAGKKLFPQSTAERIFIASEEPTEEGMCGGPALLQQSDNSDGSPILHALGLIEAKIQPKAKELQKEFPNLTVCLSAKEISNFLKVVEKSLAAEQIISDWR